MRVVIVGAGNLATNLAVALQKAGHVLIQVFSRTAQSAELLAKRVGVPAVTDLHQLAQDADLYIVSISDSALPTLDYSAFPSQALVVHTAGSIPMDVIPLTRRGVFYPMQTFSRQRIVDFREIPIFIEASSEEDTSLLTDFASSINNKVYRLSSTDRRYLHLAAVFCSNFVNHCYAMSEDILRQHGIPFSVMLPLVDEVAAKVHQVSPHDAQTGPAIRHDENVIRHHLSLLNDQPRLQQIYFLMSESIQAEQCNNLRIKKIK